MLQNSYIQIQLEWVSEYINIKENKLADKTVKQGTKIQRTVVESYISLAFIKRKVKETVLSN